MIEKLLLDMDGVLVDQEAYLASSVGLTTEAYRKQLEGLESTPEAKRMYFRGLIEDSIPNEGFIHSPPMPYLDVWKMIIQIRLDNDVPVEILSSGMSNPKTYDEVIRQKKIWLETHGLSHLPAHFVRGAAYKKDYAKRFHVLVDDSERNIKDWTTAGGYGILHTDIKSTYEELVRTW